MAQNRDFLDDLIDMTDDIKALRSPLGNLVNSLAAEPGEEPIWDPSDYKERPRPATIYCTTCKSRDKSVCTRCTDVCPKGAIYIDGSIIEIDESCLRCGLCAAVCPSECYHTKEINTKKLYDRIAGAAASHEQAYVTCTRALGRLPYDNEVVLPCVGAVPTEVWFSLMGKFSNLNVYLPLGICDRCRTMTGEEAYCDFIARAETWAGYGLGLVVDEDEMDHTMRRAWQRKEFVDSIMQSGQALVTGVNPVISAAKRVTNMLKQHKRQLESVQRQLDKAVGVTNTKRKRRVLTDRRKVVMATLQKHPELAASLDLYEPMCDPSLCTLCGKCEEVCPTHAIELTEEGRWQVANEYCVQCDACARVCPVGAITYEPCDGSELVMPDEQEKERAERDAQQKAEVERLKAQGKQGLMKGLDLLENLGDALSKGSE